MRGSIVILDFRFAPHYSAVDALAAHTLYNMAGTPNIIATHARMIIPTVIYLATS